MFGTKRRDRAARDAAQADRDADQQALTEALADRPDTVCPFLGMAYARADFEGVPNDEHRCYAFGEAAPLSHEQQGRVCLHRGYGNCPRYLRGLLVIPTDEMEALRRRRELPIESAPRAPVVELPRLWAKPHPGRRAMAGRRPGPRFGRIVLAATIVAVFVLSAGTLLAFSDLPGAGPTDATASPAVTTAPAATPSPEESASARPTPRPSPTPAVTPSAPAPSGAWTYVVDNLDSISAIAQRYGTTTETLLDLNPQYRSNPDVIHPGQRVTVPCTPIAAAEGRCP